MGALHQWRPPFLSSVRSDTPWAYLLIYIHLRYATVVSIVSNEHLHCRTFILIPGASIIAGSGPSVMMNDTAVEAMIYAMDENDNVVDEIEGVMMVF